MTKKVYKVSFFCSVLLTVSAVTFVFGLPFVRQILIEENEALVQAVAQEIFPSLMVNDLEQVQSHIKGMELNQGIESVELVNSQGASIASYARHGYDVDAAFELASIENSGVIHVMTPITFDSVIVANLYIAVNLWPAYLRIMTWLGVLLIIPSVAYVLIKQLRIKVRIEKTPHNDSSGGGGDSFNVTDAVNQAMRDADVSLAYQPIQRMSDAGLFGMEVKVSWAHPSGETLHISASDFIGLAEKERICLPFDDWLLGSAFTQAAAWQHQHGPLILTLNISASQFSDPAFAHRVRKACEYAQFPYQLLELEVNESVVLGFAENASAYLSYFAEQGLGITVDNFGLSLESTDVISILPINKVKLDRKLIKRMSYDDVVLQSLRALIDLALLHDVQVMADGIETLAQHEHLHALGCIFGQGSYFCAPMSVTSFKDFLSARPFEKQKKRLVSARLADAHGFSVI